MRPMGVPCTWPTAVSAIGPTAVGSMLWNDHGQLHLSVVVKARFALRHDASMLVATAPTIDERDQHADDDPTRSLVSASDMVPYRPRADVWLSGHAHAPRGRAVTVSMVRLGLYRSQTALLDKSVHVMGDRSSASATPTPFTKMPLVWERAYGGIGFDDNPVGVGADERALVPNLLHPDDPERAAGFAPISRYWKLRRGTLDTAGRRVLEQDVPTVPEGFDWAYFQAAPHDQRVSFLTGDEWLVLDGLHPTMLRVQSRLPKARGVARILSLHGHDIGDAVAMVADTLAIAADEQTCSITWRGSVPVNATTRLAELLVAGAVEVDGRAVDWQQARARVSPAAARPTVSSPPLDKSAITIVGTERDVMNDTNVDRASDATAVNQPSSTYHRVEVDSGEWSSDAWPSFPLAGDGDEVTETKTRVDRHRFVPQERPTEVEQPSVVPLPIDTEPGAPPEVVEDELPWITEPAVEPESQPGDASPHDFSTDAEPDSDGPENTEVMRRPAALEKPKPPRPRKALPIRPRKPLKHVSDMRPRAETLPPAPLDRTAYEASLRRAGASEDDIAKLMERVADPPADPPKT